MFSPCADSKDVETSFSEQNPFTVEHIKAMYATPFAQGFNNNQRQAAIRAILRYGANSDGAHFHTRTPAGLHPAYVSFNPFEKSEHKVLSRTELVEASLSDVFDAVRPITNDFINHSSRSS